MANDDNGYTMSVMSFARAIHRNQSQESLVPSINAFSTHPPQQESAPPVPKVPPIYQQPSCIDSNSRESLTPPGSTISSFFPDPPNHAPTTPAYEHSQLHEGFDQHPAYMPSPGVQSMQASLAGTERSTLQQAEPTAKRKPVPKREDGRSKPVQKPPPINPGTKARTTPSTWSPPPTPITPGFPGDVFETRDFDNDAHLQATTTSSSGMRSKSKVTDPSHTAIHDWYPIETVPQKAVPTKSGTSRAFEAAGNFFKGLKHKAASGFGSHRGESNKRKSGLGMSIAITGSFHDFCRKTHGQKNVLHSDLKAVPIEEVQKKLAGNRDQASVDHVPAKHRVVRVRSVFGDFMDPTIWDEEPPEIIDDASLPAQDERRNRGLSKPLPPLPPESPAHEDTAPSPNDSVVGGAGTVQTNAAIPKGWQTIDEHPLQHKRVDTSRYSWVPGHPSRTVSTQQPAPPVAGLDIVPSSPVDWEDIHNGVFPSGKRVLYDPQYHSNVDMPRFDAESLRSQDLFTDVTEDEVSRARRDQYLESASSRDRAIQKFVLESEEDDAAVDQLFDNIAQLVAKHQGIPISEKPYFNDELHRMDELLDRERRESDGSIVIDTFPHDAHTSWHATERTDDYTIHSDRRRFTREVHGNAGEQDEAGLLMERLSRQMRGLK